MRRRERASRGALLCRRGERAAAISASVAPSAIAASFSTATVASSAVPSAVPTTFSTTSVAASATAATAPV